MNIQRWDKARKAFKAAYELPTGDRKTVLERLCEGDESLRAHVDVLLGPYKVVRRRPRVSGGAAVYDRGHGSPRSSRPDEDP